ncbi:MAG: phosphoribosyl-ATP diphosphatase [Acidimicrobiales bacterium]
MACRVTLAYMILHELEDVIRSRQSADPAPSYTAKLLAEPEFNQRKIMEEAFEVCLELGRPEIHAGHLAGEAADLLYHLITALVGADVALADVFAVLESRRS